MAEGEISLWCSFGGPPITNCLWLLKT